MQRQWECKGNKKYSAGLESGLHDGGICVVLQSMTWDSHHSTDCQVLAGTVEVVLWVAGTDVTCYAESAHSLRATMSEYECTYSSC